MRRSPFVAAFVLLASAAGFFVVSAAHLPMLVYLPARGTWTWRPPRGLIAMDWFYRAGVALALAAVAFPIAIAIETRVSWARSERGVRTVFSLAFAVIGWCALYIVFALVSTPR